jgi:hypothetical protein
MAAPRLLSKRSDLEPQSARQMEQNEQGGFSSQMILEQPETWVQV